MINLLPVERKADLSAARTNSILVRYLFMSGFGILLVAIISAGTFFSLSFAKDNAENRINANDAKYASFTKVKNEGDEFRKNLATAKEILDKQVTYSKLVYEIAAVIPSGTVLDNLNLDTKSFGSVIVIEASSTSFSNAVKLKDSLQASKKLFSDVSLQSVSEEGGGENSSDKYPVKVYLQVKINQGALK